VHVVPTLRHLTVALNAILIALCGFLSLGEMVWHMFGSWLYLSVLLVAAASAGSMFAALRTHAPRLLLLVPLILNILLFSVAAYAAYLEVRNPMGLSWTSIAVTALLVAFSANIAVLGARLSSDPAFKRTSDDAA